MGKRCEKRKRERKEWSGGSVTKKEIEMESGQCGREKRKGEGGKRERAS